jgi:hypothetical protein
MVFVSMHALLTLTYFTYIMYIYIYMTFFLIGNNFFYILKKFDEKIEKYICVASEIDIDHQQQRLHLQIILNTKINTN